MTASRHHQNAPMQGVFARMPDAPDIDELKSGTERWVSRSDCFRALLLHLRLRLHFPFAITRSSCRASHEPVTVTLAAPGWFPPSLRVRIICL